MGVSNRPQRSRRLAPTAPVVTLVPAQAGLVRPWLWAGASAVLLMLLMALGWWWLQPPALLAQAAQARTMPLARLDFRQWLAGHEADWRVGWLTEEPAVLVIEFPNLAEQGAAMNRVAALLEKTGAPRDRVLGDAELHDLISRGGDNPQTFYLGHDYVSAGLARFFALAQAQQLALNPHEQRLLVVLTGAGVVVPASGGAPGYVSPKVQALITFTAPQTDDPATPADEGIDEGQRESILRHEASHGRFYTRPVYQAHSRQFWRTELTEPQRERIRVYLASAGYNRQDEELMLNEAQAFLLHTPDQRAFMAQDIGMTPAELDALQTRFWRTLPSE